MAVFTIYKLRLSFKLNGCVELLNKIPSRLLGRDGMKRNVQVTRDMTAVDPANGTVAIFPIISDLNYQEQEDI